MPLQRTAWPQRPGSRLSVPSVTGRRLRQDLFDEGPVGCRVEALLDDALRRRDGQAGELLAEVGDGSVALQLNLATSPLEQVLRVRAGLLAGFLLDASRDLLRLGDELLALLAGLVQLFRYLLLGLREALLGLFRSLEPFLDAPLALVEGREQELLEDPAEQDQQDREVDELSDQPGEVDAKRTDSLGCEDYLDHGYLPMPFR